jgi:uncharacterized protein
VKIDLSKIEDEPKAFAETITLAEDRLDPNLVAGPMTVRLEGTVRPAGDHYLVTGRADAEGLLSCGRCLEPVDWRMESAFDIEIALAQAAPLDPEIALEEDDLDVVYLEKSELDLEKLAMEQIELELPMRVVCSEDCAGLCPSCGANRNSGETCRCEPDADPRWEALKELSGETQAD